MAENLKTFGALPVGAKFKTRGEPFTKTAASMAEDRQRNGVIFQSEVEVEPEAGSKEPTTSGTAPQNPS